MSSHPSQIKCDCESIKVTLSTEPGVRGFCHCEDCRYLLKIPYHSVTAWKKQKVSVDEGHDARVAFQHPRKGMKQYFCALCGETRFNSNAMDRRIVSQSLIRKCNGGELPEPLQPATHFFCRRIVNIDDDLPRRA